MVSFIWKASFYMRTTKKSTIYLLLSKKATRGKWRRLWGREGISRSWTHKLLQGILILLDKMNPFSLVSLLHINFFISATMNPLSRAEEMEQIANKIGRLLFLCGLYAVNSAQDCTCILIKGKCSKERRGFPNHTKEGKRIVIVIKTWASFSI